MPTLETMGFLANGTWVIDTTGNVIESGGGLTAYCGSRLERGYILDLDVYDLAIQFGRRARFVGEAFPLKCGKCGYGLSARLPLTLYPDEV